MAGSSNQELRSYADKVSYVGVVENYDHKVYKFVSGTTTELPTCTDTYNHSRELAWGYAGSGPAQLALAILCDLFQGDTERALRLHQEFKFDIIVNLNGDSGWVLKGHDLLERALTLEAAWGK